MKGRGEGKEREGKIGVAEKWQRADMESDWEGERKREGEREREREGEGGRERGREGEREI